MIYCLKLVEMIARPIVDHYVWKGADQPQRLFEMQCHVSQESQGVVKK